MKKKNIIIVLNYSLYLKSYINSDSFKHLEKKYNIYYVLDSSIKETEIKKIVKKPLYKKFKKKIILIFKYKKIETKFFSMLFNRVQFRNRNKIKNISYLVNRQLKFKLFYNYVNESFFTGVKRFLLWCIKFSVRILNYIFIHEIFDEIFKKFIKTNQSLVNTYKKMNPDLVIIPFNGNHISIFDSIRYFKKINQKKIFLLSENWDNLFSRYMINHPSYISVWGQQSKNILKVHKFKGKAYNLGAPRLEPYFKEKNIKYKNPYNFNYAVYFDNASPRKNDNLIFLSKIDNFIEKNKNDFKNFKLIFRPHPYTFLHDISLIDFKNYKNIILDPQMKSRYNYNLPSSKIKSSDGKYSIGLIKNAKFIACSASSVIIEASIFYKNIIIYSPKNNSYNKKFKLLDLWEHFKDVSKFPNIKVCDDENKIGPMLKEFNNNKLKISKQRIDKLRNNILYSNKLNYSKRLYDTVNKIIK